MADKTIICAPLDQRSSPALSEPSPALNSSRLWSPTLAASQSHPSSPSTRQDGDVNMADAPAAGPAEFKKPLDINSLMSPPELAPFENFSNYSAMRGAVADARADKKAGGPKPLLSPPISPFTRASNTIDPVPAAGVGLRDPILYPSSDIASSPPQPLFGPDEQSKDDAQQLVDEHVASRPANLFRKATPPEREDYELALFFKSAVMEKFANNPKGWLRKEREFLRADRKASAERRSHLQPVLPAKEIIARGIAAKPPRPAPRASKADKIVKPRARPAPQRIAPQRPSPQRIAPLSSTTPPNHASTGKRLPSATPEPRSRPVAPSREDKDFHLLPDYCPPLSSLPNKPNSLKIDWKGNPLDLSNDPHRHLLHPDELQLAASLRLDCATYLTSKRRIFMSRLECATKPKEFRKTDAQQACKIDVNKASKLWTAYDKVDWLNLAWMKPHLAAAGK